MFMNGSEPWSCKPDYVRFRAPVIYLPSFEGSAINPKLPDRLSPVDLPTSGRGRAAPSSLFDLAPDGVCLAQFLAEPHGGLLHHLFTLAGIPKNTGGLFSVALSVSSVYRNPSRIAAFTGRDTLPYGVRTFLPAHLAANRATSRSTATLPEPNYVIKAASTRCGHKRNSKPSTDFASHSG